MTSSRSRWFRLSMFGIAYVIQGAALAYFRNFQKPYLDGLGIDADAIGLLTSILLLPFILKIFIGMLSDRVSLFGMGHRKPYMILGLLFGALTFGAAGFVLPDQNFGLFALLIVGSSFSVALFDSTTDGLAIDVTPRADCGTVQGTMVGGRAAGFILLSLVFGALVASQGSRGYSGYRTVFTVIAACMLLPLLWVIWVREPRERAAGQSFQWAAFGQLLKPCCLAFAAYAVLYSIVSFGVDGLVTFYLSDRFRVAETTIGLYGALRGVGAVLGAAGGGLLIDRVGRKAMAYGAVLAISIGAALIGAAPGVNATLILGVAWGIAWGFQETLFVALAMDLADARIAASMFAIMMALSNLGTAVGEGVATGLTDDIGFSAVFWLLAGLNVAVVPILWALFRFSPEIARPTSDPAACALDP
jgi:PAT family beta-lactamase induction signal transducer AmpG